jgi:hypothetical protein
MARGLPAPAIREEPLARRFSLISRRFFFVSLAGFFAAAFLVDGFGFAFLASAGETVSEASSMPNSFERS